MEGPFSDSLIRNPTMTFAEIRHRVVTHINTKKAVSVKHRNTYLRQFKPKESSRARPLRVNEAMNKKRTDARRAPYSARKTASKEKAREDLAFRSKFRMTYMELLSIPGVVEN